MKKNKKYKYVPATRHDEHGSRTYEVSGLRLPSVTTILAKTKNQYYINKRRNLCDNLADIYGSGIQHPSCPTANW